MKRALVAVLVCALSLVCTPANAQRTDRVVALRGAGTWIDVYDWAPSYTKRPGVSTETMKAIKASGVSTVFIQASRSERSSLLVDASTLRGLVAAAKAQDLWVVLWYLPAYRSSDIARIDAMMSLAPDGIALDLESRKAPTQQQVLDLLTKAREVIAAPTPLIATVYPPDGTKVTGRTTWPSFPWTKASALVDVWALMAYWRESSTFSPAPDEYVARSLTSLQKQLPQEALLHLIGGIRTTPAQARMLKSKVTGNVIGASIYDWRSSSPSAHTALTSK